jgi:chemotaxis protein MotB
MASGGGGAWKVAYADFVTAMMAFFLVMWIAGQDQKIRRSVSDYFSDPMGSPDGGATKKPVRTGSLYDSVNSGSVPLEDGVAMGQGRRAFGQKRASSPVTKLINDWLQQDPKISEYWTKQAEDLKESAKLAKDAKKNDAGAEKQAIRKLTVQMQQEFKKNMPANVAGIYRDLLLEACLDVNWDEIAEDLMDTVTVGH